MMLVVTRTCKSVVSLGVANAGQPEREMEKSRKANEKSVSDESPFQDTPLASPELNK